MTAIGSKTQYPSQNSLYRKVIVNNLAKPVFKLYVNCVFYKDSHVGDTMCVVECPLHEHERQNYS